MVRGSTAMGAHLAQERGRDRHGEGVEGPVPSLLGGRGSSAGASAPRRSHSSAEEAGAGRLQEGSTMGSTELNPMHEHPIGDRRYSKALHGHENDEPGHTHAAGSEHGYRDEDLGPGRE